MSAQYPKTIFIVTSGSRAHGNVAPLIFRLEEASYLAGMVAGGLDRSNILGFVGGIELPPIKAAYEGWVNGAKAVNPKVRSREIYLNSFDDAAAGREAALALIRVGADMFHHNADAAALGVFQAAKESPGVYVFGANADQSALAPDRVVGSAVIDLPRALLLVAREVKAGTFTPKVEVVRARERRGPVRAQSGARHASSRRRSRRGSRRRRTRSPRVRCSRRRGRPSMQAFATARTRRHRAPHPARPRERPHGDRARCPWPRSSRTSTNISASARCPTSGTRSTGCRSRTWGWSAGSWRPWTRRRRRSTA